MSHDKPSSIITHVLSHLGTPRLNCRPLFVAIQGPQGIGKSTLTSNITNGLSSPPHSLHIVSLSLDDFYLPHQALRALGGRGPPGTHDLPLAVSVLHALQVVNSNPSGTTTVTLPRFDKSAHGGEGDRSPVGEDVRGPVDVVILEGWCVGFLPIPEAELERLCNLGVDAVGVDMRQYDVGELKIANERLKKYTEVWNFFDTFVQLEAPNPPFLHIYRWRLEQEHDMKSRNGGKGMSDEQVSAFVKRYLPSYVLFSGGVTASCQPWAGKGLRMLLDEERNFQGVERF